MDDKRPPTPPFAIAPARTKRDLAAVAELFEAYAASLPIDLGYQGFGPEVAELPGKYAPPRGELLVARDSFQHAVGCAALRPLGNCNHCEMKRLYITPEARSFGLGRMLTEAIISEARLRGYSALFLDTLATMTTAASLYARMGFDRIESYYGPTPPGTIFMRMELDARAKPARK